LGLKNSLAVRPERGTGPAWHGRTAGKRMAQTVTDSKFVAEAETSAAEEIKTLASRLR